MSLPLPELLTSLLASGVWPSGVRAEAAQNLQPIVSTERVRNLAAEESVICLFPPPFRTLADEVAAASPALVDEYWDKLMQLHQVIAEKCLMLGDFGLGSDAPIVLNYAVDPDRPPVYRLRWSQDGKTQWVQVTRDFDEFANLLGFTE